MNMNISQIEHAIAQVRVSSIKQDTQGDSPDQQKDLIENKKKQVELAKGVSIVIDKWFDYAQSASGDIELQPIISVIEYCKTHPVKYLFIKSIDRFTRGGSTTYGFLKMQLAKYGVQIIDAYGVIGQQSINTLDTYKIEYDWSVYSPTYIAEILQAEQSKGEVRDILSRMIGAQIHYVRSGYHVRAAPPGYQNTRIETPQGKRIILTPHPIESPWFTRMFELRIQGNLSDPEIVGEINSMGFLTRTRKLHDKINTNEDRRRGRGSRLFVFEGLN